MSKRAAYLKALVDQMHLPYLWDGKGLPGEPYNGRDCSGAVTSPLYKIGGPDWRASHNAQALFDKLASPVVVKPGDLAFWRNADGRVHHVMSVLFSDPPTWMVIGSASGDQSTTTVVEAFRRGAEVQVWESHLRMAGFCGFRSIPYLDS